MAVLPLTEKD